MALTHSCIINKVILIRKEGDKPLTMHVPVPCCMDDLEIDYIDLPEEVEELLNCDCSVSVDIPVKFCPVCGYEDGTPTGKTFEKEGENMADKYSPVLKKLAKS